MASSPSIGQRVATIRSVVERSQLTLLAAAIAFYGLLSIVPLTVVVIAVATAIGGGAAIGPILEALEYAITPEAMEIVQAGLQAPAGQSGATATGLVFATWGSLRVFRGLDQAFNSIYGRPGHATILRTVKNALAVLAAVLGIVAALTAGMTGMVLLGVRMPSLLVPLVMAPLIALVFIPMYWVFPPIRQPLRAVLPGAVFAGLGVTVATALLQIYVAIAAPYAIYGVLAGVFIAMTWLYVIAGVMLLGVVLNATRIGRDRQVQAPRS